MEFVNSLVRNTKPMLLKAEEIINGCGVFDAEHVMLINLINAIHKLLKEGRKEDAKRIFKEGLVAYTEKHLSHEEEVMEKYGYPELEKHKKAHEIFKKVISEDMNKLDDAKAFAAEAALAMGWVFGHIRKSDRKYVEWFKEKGCWSEACEELEKPVRLGIEGELREILGEEFVELRNLKG